MPPAYLTGDGNVVLLNATLFYRINDPMSYSLSQTHVRSGIEPAVPRDHRARHGGAQSE